MEKKDLKEKISTIIDNLDTDGLNDLSIIDFVRDEIIKTSFLEELKEELRKEIKAIEKGQRTNNSEKRPYIPYSISEYEDSFEKLKKHTASLEVLKKLEENQQSFEKEMNEYKNFESKENDLFYNHKICEQIQFLITQLNSYYVNRGIMTERQTNSFIRKNDIWCFEKEI